MYTHAARRHNKIQSRSITGNGTGECVFGIISFDLLLFALFDHGTHIYLLDTLMDKGHAQGRERKPRK